jgi:hypothetical protein
MIAKGGCGLTRGLKIRGETFKKFKREATVSWVDEEDDPYEEKGERARSVVKKEDTYIPNPP